MPINILDVKPHQISPSIEGKSFFFYGEPKSGKTTLASQFPDPLLLGFEKGWNMISGIKAIPIDTWYEALNAQQQLIQLRAQYNSGQIDDPVYRTIIIDTADIAATLAEKYILQKEHCNYLDETESKRGYEALRREYDNFIQELQKAGYGVINISHTKTVQVKNRQTGEKVEQTVPTLHDRIASIVSRFSDFIGYISKEEDEDGNLRRYITFRADGSDIMCGSRAKDMPERIELSYDALEAAVKEAILAEANAKNMETVSKTEILYNTDTELPTLEEIKGELAQYAKAFNAADAMNHFKAITNRYLGVNKMVMDCDDSQIEILMMIRDAAKVKTDELGILVGDQKPATKKKGTKKAAE